MNVRGIWHDAGMSGEYDDVRALLNDASEILGDRILTLLSDAVREGASSRPPQERVLTRARRSIDKAIMLLDGIDTAT